MSNPRVLDVIDLTSAARAVKCDAMVLATVGLWTELAIELDDLQAVASLLRILRAASQLTSRGILKVEGDRDLSIYIERTTLGGEAARVLALPREIGKRAVILRPIEVLDLDVAEVARQLRGIVGPGAQA